MNRHVQRYALAELPPQRWKNGGGVTRELARVPAGADDFDWRVSVAEIASDGPFSAFPGVDRVILLLEGDGVELRERGAATAHRLDEALQPHAFAGEAAIDCRRLGAASTDFNVMTRRGRGTATVDVLRAATAWSASAGLVHAARGHWRATPDDGGGTVEIAAATGLWWQGAARTWRLEPASDDAAAIAVQWRPR